MKFGEVDEKRENRLSPKGRPKPGHNLKEELLDGLGQVNPFPCLWRVICIRAWTESELTITDFDEFNLVAGLESKLLPNICGEGDPTVEGDHCWTHLEPLCPILTGHWLCFVENTAICL
jgi:hypothetical protein